mgnify:CR=1 FL=1
MEYTHAFSSSLFSKIGFTVHQSKVKEFTEQESAFNVHIDEFDMTVFGEIITSLLYGHWVWMNFLNRADIVFEEAA